VHGAGKRPKGGRQGTYKQKHKSRQIQPKYCPIHIGQFLITPHPLGDIEFVNISSMRSANVHLIRACYSWQLNVTDGIEQHRGRSYRPMNRRSDSGLTSESRSSARRYCLREQRITQLISSAMNSLSRPIIHLHRTTKPNKWTHEPLRDRRQVHRSTAGRLVCRDLMSPNWP